MSRLLGRGVLAILAYLLFAGATKHISSHPMQTAEIEGSVVLPPALQTVLYFGDPYLAANVESSRILATGGDLKGVLGDYYHRLYPTIAQLNPCHEDNYYIANAFLAWAGGVEPALHILKEATQCRFWDEVPPFFLGYNLYFFKHAYADAKASLDLAAGRSTENRVGFQKIGIMFGSGAYPDTQSALNYLLLQRDQSSDPKLRAMLDQRIARLSGLIRLREAQASFEQRLGKKLENPMDLISSGTLKEFPSDPMRLGYEFGNGRFSLKELRIRGMENARK